MEFNGTVLAAFAVAAVAALFHVYVFALESLLWTTERARRVFGTTRADAQTTRVLAFNQGFYNLFLVVEIAAGIGLYATHHTTSGAVLVLFGAGSMVAAGAVLIASQPAKLRAGLLRAAPALVAIVLLAFGLAR
jgi:putative membrane protein